MAIARKLLVILYHVLSTLNPYEEPKLQSANKQAKQRTIQKHLRELQKLGLDVQISSILATV